MRAAQLAEVRHADESSQREPVAGGSIIGDGTDADRAEGRGAEACKWVEAGDCCTGVFEHESAIDEREERVKAAVRSCQLHLLVARKCGRDAGLEEKDQPPVDGKVVREYVPTERGNYMDFFTGVYEAIRNGKPLPVTAEEAVRIIRVIEKAYESVKEKKIVPFR